MRNGPCNPARDLTGMADSSVCEIACAHSELLLWPRPCPDTGVPCWKQVRADRRVCSSCRYCRPTELALVEHRVQREGAASLLRLQTWLVDALLPEPGSECWLHPHVQVGPSPIAQLGLFAGADIASGVVVCRLGGRLVTGRELQRIFAEAAQRPDHPYVDTIAVGEDVHLVLPSGQPSHYGNHSCDPNLWWADAYTLVARRTIGVGEEVTSDYATSTGVAAFAMNCACRSSLCRAVITGEDWRRPELQARYGDHWIPMLLARIRESAR
jgi:uncharacterized protein